LTALLRGSVGTAVCDLGRADSPAAAPVLAAADVVLCVYAPDVASMRGARALPVPARVVLNQAARARLHGRDVARVLGERPAGVIPFDARVRRSGETGRLPARGAATKAIRALASTIQGETDDGS
jgi:Flp pilus assembly CpaE family ATPase